MSERITAVRSNLPRGNWGLLLKFTDCADIAYRQVEADFLTDVVNDPLMLSHEPRTELDDGVLYTSLFMEDVTGDELLANAASLTLRGITRLALTPELRARTIPQKQLNPTPGTLAQSFRYSLCDDVSDSFDAAMADVRDAALWQQTLDSEYELSRLLNSN